MLKRKLDNGKTLKSKKVQEIIKEINKRSKVIKPIDILKSAIIKHREMAKTTTKELQIKIKNINHELQDFIKSANKLKFH